jgi:pentose-5-phosphate-3-epimerase
MYVAKQKIENIVAVQDKAYNIYYTVDGDIYTSTIQTIQLAHCCVSLATMFMQRNLDAILYIHRRSNC